MLHRPQPVGVESLQKVESQLGGTCVGGRARGRALFEYLMEHGVIGDWREPDVIRISPAPLYNRFADCLTFAEAVRAWAS